MKHNLIVTLISTVVFFLAEFFLLSLFNPSQTLGRILVQAAISAVLWAVFILIFRGKGKNENHTQ